ncbi:MAG: DUF2442 domain-containing protein [Bacteroidetes bacterium]|nr:DUF2442 domain-containing protein [Bacteroidota bacterium]MBP7477356.1 DUF2442 domain-containing protein [Chitinophagales bacterium]
MRFIHKIIKIDSYKITVAFDNQEIKTIDIFSFLNLDSISLDSIYAKLKDMTYFNNVRIDSYGALSWNDEIDFCPDVLYRAGELAKV